MKDYQPCFLAVGSGDACLELIANKHEFDVVLLDVWLPGMDGLGSLQKIREIDKRARSHYDFQTRHH